MLLTTSEVKQQTAVNELIVLLFSVRLGPRDVIREAY